jgi:hypothetical protein
MNRMTKGMLIAGAAAGLLMSGAVPARASSHEGGDKVHCLGVNACKGQGACATADNQCAGKNACKGKGVVEMSAADCKAKGGTVKAEKKEH